MLTRRLPLYLLFLFISLVFLVVNLACALLVRMSSAETHTVVLVRVTINDSLFVLCAVSLSLCLYKIAKMSLANIYLESKVTNAPWHRENVRYCCMCCPFELFLSSVSVISQASK